MNIGLVIILEALHPGADVHMCPGTEGAAPAGTPLPDLLGDLLGGGAGFSAPAPSVSAQPTLSLRSHPHLTPQEFQGKWGALQPAAKESLMLAPPQVAAAVAGGLQVSTVVPEHKR